MNDWKGKKVNIQVWMVWSELVYENDVYLDTDTLTDLFAVYDPSIYSFNIEPIEGDEDD